MGMKKIYFIEITNSEIIEILENPENYQFLLINLCEKEFERRSISQKEITSLTREIIRKKIVANLHNLSYYHSPSEEIRSRFLSSNEIKDIFTEEFAKYRNDQDSFNSKLPVG